MTTAWQCDHCALRADLTHVKFFKKVHQLDRRVTCDVSRSDKDDHWTEDQPEKDQDRDDAL